MAVILTAYYRPKPGGLCQRQAKAILALARAGHEVHYLACAPLLEAQPDANAVHVRFHRFPWPSARAESVPFWLCFTLTVPFLLAWLALRHRVTHAFAFHAHYAFLLEPARRLRRMPLALFVRGDAQAHHRLKAHSGWMARVELWVERQAVRHAQIYAVSRALMQTLRARHRSAGLPCCDVLPNDLPAPMISGGQRDTPSGPPHLVVAGVLEHLKNQSVLLDALALLPPASCRLTIFGDGPDAARLKAQAQTLGIADRVAFPGWAPAPEIFRDCDLFLFPSLSEGAPNSVLEAIAQGVPVVASHIPAHAEILPAGQLVAAIEPLAWSNRIADLLAGGKPALAQLRIAQEAASTRLRFDWETAVVARILSDRCLEDPTSANPAVRGPTT